MNERMMRRLAKPMLFAAAFIWGSSFFVMKDALDALPVQYLLAIRFTTGAVLLGFAPIFVAVVCSETKFSFMKKRGNNVSDNR